MGHTASSLSAPPTAREITLLFILLVFLLVTSSNLTSSLQSDQLGSHLFSQPLPETHHNHNVTHANGVMEPKRFETVLSWGESEKVPDTVIVAHVPGWTILDRLYALNGTLYVVTDDPASVPDRKLIISTAMRIVSGPEERAKWVPTDRELQVISTTDAKTLFGSGADVLDGVTVRLVILTKTLLPPLTNYASGMPTTQANCEVHLHTLWGHVANRIDPALPTIITGLLNSSLDSGGHIPRLILLSRRTETQPYPRHAECYSRTSTTTTGGIMLR
jgi:hypothetical protein